VSQFVTIGTAYTIAMIRLNNRIILTAKERNQLTTIVGEPCNPQTVEEYNAWLELTRQDCDPSIPDLRIFAAVLQEMKLPELQPCNSGKDI